MKLTDYKTLKELHSGLVTSIEQFLNTKRIQFDPGSVVIESLLDQSVRFRYTSVNRQETYAVSVFALVEKKT